MRNVEGGRANRASHVQQCLHLFSSHHTIISDKMQFLHLYEASYTAIYAVNTHHVAMLSDTFQVTLENLVKSGFHHHYYFP